MGINPDGIFMFAPDMSGENGFDPDFAEEICLALESALNSSSLNMKENPHLFIKCGLPPNYDSAKWGRTIDRDEWLAEREPKFDEFIDELRSDIFKNYGNLQITDFSMKIDDQGKLTITDVKTKGNAHKANALATEKMNRGLTSEIEKKAEYLGVLIFAARNARYGDVMAKGTIMEQFDYGVIGDIKLFKQEIVITSDSGYKVVPTNDRSSSTGSIFRKGAFFYSGTT
ncbi:MAG: hypothetical protein LBJ00_11600 [Planctomycetaceae bacterium]|jgi:hypothetical protein|nr:hypothetical protein [Planctomycetaceae bacterium]